LVRPAALIRNITCREAYTHTAFRDTLQNPPPLKVGPLMRLGVWRSAEVAPPASPGRSPAAKRSCLYSSSFPLTERIPERSRHFLFCRRNGVLKDSLNKRNAVLVRSGSFTPLAIPDWKKCQLHSRFYRPIPSKHYCFYADILLPRLIFNLILSVYVTRYMHRYTTR